MKHDLMADAIRSAGEVYRAALKSFSLEPPSQQQLREEFRRGLETPEGLMGFAQRYGDDVVQRQLDLALRRNRG